MRVVLDTNTVVSALLWGRVPEKLLVAATEGRIELFTSEALLSELAGVLPRAKFAQRILKAQRTSRQLIEQYRGLVSVIEPADIAPTVAGDRDDDRVLACALAANADLIVSGDDDLLNLKHFHGIAIISAADASRRIESDASQADDSIRR